MSKVIAVILILLQSTLAHAFDFEGLPDGTKYEAVMKYLEATNRTLEGMSGQNPQDIEVFNLRAASKGSPIEGLKLLIFCKRALIGTTEFGGGNTARLIANLADAQEKNGDPEVKFSSKSRQKGESDVFINATWRSSDEVIKVVLNTSEANASMAGESFEFYSLNHTCSYYH